MVQLEAWCEELAAAVIVTNAEGTIIAMNQKACAIYAAEGGRALVGRLVFDCHPEPARTKTIELYQNRRPNHYTIAKNGQKKLIHQLPWYKDGAFAGFVELSIPIPEHLPHFDRG